MAAAWENCARYLSKGRKVCVVGQIHIRNYDAQDGTKRTVVEVDADDVEFMPNAGQPAGEGGFRPAPAPAAPSGFAPAESGFTQVDEDELPF